MRVITFALMIMILLVGVSSAQMAKNINIYAGGGVDIPLNDLKEYWKNGYGGMIGFGYKLSPGFEGVARYAYHTFSSDTDTLVTDFLANTMEDFTVHEYSVDFRANLASPGMRLRPYGLIGVGMAQMPDESKFFYSVGGGFKTKAFPKVNFFIEVRYTRLSVDPHDVGYVPISMGINLSI